MTQISGKDFEEAIEKASQLFSKADQFDDSMDIGSAYKVIEDHYGTRIANEIFPNLSKQGDLGNKIDGNVNDYYKAHVQKYNDSIQKINQVYANLEEAGRIVQPWINFHDQDYTWYKRIKFKKEEKNPSHFFFHASKEGTFLAKPYRFGIYSGTVNTYWPLVRILKNSGDYRLWQVDGIQFRREFLEDLDKKKNKVLNKNNLVDVIALAKARTRGKGRTSKRRRSERTQNTYIDQLTQLSERMLRIVTRDLKNG